MSIVSETPLSDRHHRTSTQSLSTTAQLTRTVTSRSSPTRGSRSSTPETRKRRSSTPPPSTRSTNRSPSPNSQKSSARCGRGMPTTSGRNRARLPWSPTVKWRSIATWTNRVTPNGPRGFWYNLSGQCCPNVTKEIREALNV